MSNRFHNKFHKQNHHSDPTPGYPDSAMDPIASFDQPFKGEFYSQGDIITTENLSAKKYVYADDGYIHNNLFIKGNLTVVGETTQLDTLVYATSAISVTNSGTGPAAMFRQTGNQPVAHFLDDSNTALFIDGRTATPGYVGIGTDTPGAKLTIAGNLSSSGTATIGTIATGATNSVITQFGGLLQKREVNSHIWDTTAKFISASDGALTVNRLTKAENSNGIDESIVYDDGTNVGIGTDTPGAKLTISGTLSTSGTATIGTLATGTGSSFVIESNGLLQKRSLNIDTTATFVSASDGALTVNRLTKATNSNGINESVIEDDGSLVSIAGNLSSSGTATIGTIATGATNSVLIQSTGLLQKRDINPQVWDTTAKYVSASDGALTVNRLTKAENSNGIDESIVFDNGTNVGIGTDTPGAKLTVSGTLSTSGTATIGTIATGTSDYVLIESNGLIQKRTVDSLVTGSSVAIVDGTGIANRVAYWTDSNTISADSNFFFNGINVGVGTDAPGAKLTINGTLSTAGTATIGTINTGATNNDVVVLGANNILEKRTINSTSWNPGATYQPIITGAATTIDTENLTTGRALVSDTNGKVAVSDITSAELNHLDGVSSNIQTQLNSKQPNLGFTPVQQGGGTGQGTNKIYIGWIDPLLGLQVDTANFGTDWPINIVGMVKPKSNQVTPSSSVALSNYSNDIILSGHTSAITINSFAGGIQRATYTVTNEGNFNVTLTASTNIVTRGGNTWSSHKCSSTSYDDIILTPGSSCSVRVKTSHPTTSIVSAW